MRKSPKSHGRRKLAGLVCLGLLAGGGALAQTPIGGAKDVQKDVRGQTGSKTVKIALGDQVFQNELVRTGVDSLARIVFLDETNMSVGPTSEVKLDKYVYDPNGDAKAVVFNASKGAFRFFSGNSDHSVYSVQTPQAVIGVRGTVYDVKVDRGVTTVVLVEGAVNVCVVNTARCAEIAQPGQSIVVRGTDLEGPLAPGQQAWNFGEFCGADASQSPYCTRATKLGLDLTPKTPKPPPAKAVPVKAAPAKAAPPPVRQRVQRVAPERPVKVVRAKPPRRRYVEEEVETYYVREPAYVRRPVITPAIIPAIGIGIGIGLGGFRGGHVVRGDRGPMRGNSTPMRDMPRGGMR